MAQRYPRAQHKEHGEDIIQAEGIIFKQDTFAAQAESYGDPIYILFGIINAIEEIISDGSDKITVEDLLDKIFKFYNEGYAKYLRRVLASFTRLRYLNKHDNEVDTWVINHIPDESITGHLREIVNFNVGDNGGVTNIKSLVSDFEEQEDPNVTEIKSISGPGRTKNKRYQVVKKTRKNAMLSAQLFPVVQGVVQEREEPKKPSSLVSSRKGKQPERPPSSSQEEEDVVPREEEEDVVPRDEKVSPPFRPSQVSKARVSGVVASRFPAERSGEGGSQKSSNEGDTRASPGGSSGRFSVESIGGGGSKSPGKRPTSSSRIVSKKAKSSSGKPKTPKKGLSTGKSSTGEFIRTELNSMRIADVIELAEGLDVRPSGVGKDPLKRDYVNAILRNQTSV